MVRTLSIGFNKQSIILFLKINLNCLYCPHLSFPPLQVQPCVRGITADLGSVLRWSSRSQPAKSQRPYSAGQLVCACLLFYVCGTNGYNDVFVCVWSTYKRCGFLKEYQCVYKHMHVLRIRIKRRDWCPYTSSSVERSLIIYLCMFTLLM